MLGTEQAANFFDILNMLYKHQDDPNVYQYVLQQIVESFSSEAGTIYLADNKMATLVPMASVGASVSTLKKLPFKFGLGICGWVAQDNQSLMLNDVHEDKRFTDLYDKLTGFETRAVLCSPMAVKKECLGVVELFNRMDRAYQSEDLLLLDMVCKHLAIALENTILSQQVNRLSAFNSSILNCLPGGFVAVDKQGLVNICNQKAMEVLGIQDKNILGEPMESAFKKHPVFLTVFQLTIKENKLLLRQEVEIPRTPGHTMRLGYSTVFIRAENGELMGYGMVFQDITHFKK